MANAINPIPNFLTDKLLKAVSMINSITQQFVDGDNNPMPVLTRTVYATALAQYPEITLNLRPGTFQMQAGYSKLIEYSDGTSQSAIIGRDSVLFFEVRALSQYERLIILDQLLFNILAAYAADARWGFSGPVVNGAVLQAFNAWGIIVKEIGTVEYLVSSLVDPRPQGQVYHAVLPLRCDMTLAWTSDPYQSP